MSEWYVVDHCATLLMPAVDVGCAMMLKTSSSSLLQFGCKVTRTTKI